MIKRVWLVRQGRRGEFEPFALEQNRLTIDFSLRGGVEGLDDRDIIHKALAKALPNAAEGQLRNFAAQVNQFVNIAKEGDLAVCPMKTTSTVWIGAFTGPAQAGQNGFIQRPVRWLREDIPRDVFRQDMLYSLGAIMTVCEITRNNARERLQRVADGGVDPGDGLGHALSDGNGIQDAADQPVNLEETARDQIESRIGSIFAGHDFTALVAAILAARGYVVRVSPPGTDKGVDIVAGSGVLGMESPRITVQVKSGNQRIEQPDLQALIGSVHDTGADQGLIVSWAGFTNAVRARTNELYFRVRLWGREELVENLLAVYDRLPEDVRAALPLRPVWTLIINPDDEPEP